MLSLMDQRQALKTLNQINQSYKSGVHCMIQVQQPITIVIGAPLIRE